MKRRVFFLVATMALVVLAAGTALALNVVRCEGRSVCDGTGEADLMTGDAVRNDMYGRGGPDTVRGFVGRDFLAGGGGRDVLEGGNDGDFFVGGGAADTLIGGRGADEFQYYSNGWGRDTIEDSDAPNPEDLAPNSLFFLPEAPVNMVVDLESGPGPEASNGGGTATIGWEDDAIGSVQLGAPGVTENRVYGNAAGNLLAVGIREPGEGTDTVWGRGGDDYIVVSDGEADDTVTCGDGDDVVYCDVGDTIDADCETQRDPDPRPGVATP